MSFQFSDKKSLNKSFTSDNFHLNPSRVFRLVLTNTQTHTNTFLSKCHQVNSPISFSKGDFLHHQHSSFQNGYEENIVYWRRVLKIHESLSLYPSGGEGRGCLVRGKQSFLGMIMTNALFLQPPIFHDPVSFKFIYLQKKTKTRISITDEKFKICRFLIVFFSFKNLFHIFFFVNL